MATLSRAIQLLAKQDRESMLTLLKAVLIRLKDDDEEAVLIVTDEEIRRADRYSLITTTIDEDKAVVLTVRMRP